MEELKDIFENLTEEETEYYREIGEEALQQVKNMLKDYYFVKYCGPLQGCCAEPIYQFNWIRIVGIILIIILIWLVVRYPIK